MPYQPQVHSSYPFPNLWYSRFNSTTQMGENLLQISDLAPKAEILWKNILLPPQCKRRKLPLRWGEIWHMNMACLKLSLTYLEAFHVKLTTLQQNLQQILCFMLFHMSTAQDLIIPLYSMEYQLIINLDKSTLNNSKLIQMLSIIAVGLCVPFRRSYIQVIMYVTFHISTNIQNLYCLHDDIHQFHGM